MIAGLDSSFPPSPSTALAAKAGGVALWSGYISTAPYDGGSHFGLYHPWPQEGFEYARLCGSTPIAYCSGWDSPGALKALAAAWNVRLCLDIEGGIRPDGPWKQPWLDASGAGVYGNYPCHDCRAPFHVISDYVSPDPRATWPNPPAIRPATPCGWQWQGTHIEFGVSVDRGNYDDFFGPSGGDFMANVSQADWDALIWRVAVMSGNAKAADVPAAYQPYIKGVVSLADVKADLDAIKATGGGGLTPEQAAQLTTIDTGVAAIESQLKAGLKAT